LTADKNIGLMMPCKINVFVEGSKTIISGMQPTVISQFYPNADLGTVPQEVEAVIHKIIDEVK